MKPYSSVFFNVLRASTAVTLFSVASVSAFAMANEDEGENLTPSITKGYVSSANYKPVPFFLNPSYGAASIEIDRWGKPKRITTDNNNLASYQLESNRFPVKPGDAIRILYKIRVLPGGKMSLGLLNSARNGWDGEELVLQTYKYEHVINRFTHEGIYESTVPAGENITSLVLRNYHLDTPGETTFIIEKIEIEKKEVCWLNSTGLSKSVKQEENGQITVITDNNNHASYQLESDRVLVAPDNLLKTNYKLTVHPGGKVSIGYLSTARTHWYEKEDVFGEGTHQGTFESFVPAEEKETSLVVRNYHLGAPGQSTFTIEHLDFQNEDRGYSIVPKDMIGLIFQECSLQTIGRFSCASRECKALGDGTAIWAHVMKQHNYPTLTNCPNLQDATKFDFMAHHFEYAQFTTAEPTNKAEPLSLSNSINCKIKVKNLLKLLEVFPPNAKKESYFPIGNDSFILKQQNRKVFLDYGNILATEPTHAHSLEHLNPEATVIFSSLGNWFTAVIPVGLHTYEETEFNSERDLYEAYKIKQYNKQYSEGRFTFIPDPLKDYIQNLFYIQCITEERYRSYFKSTFS